MINEEWFLKISNGIWDVVEYMHPDGRTEFVSMMDITKLTDHDKIVGWRYKGVMYRKEDIIALRTPFRECRVLHGNRRT